MAKTADRYFGVDPWRITEEGFDPAYSRVGESVFSLANESMGVRGYFDEGGSVDSLRGAYINGVYDLEQLNRSYRGIIDHTHFMIPAVDWLRTRAEEVHVDAAVIASRATVTASIDNPEDESNPLAVGWRHEAVGREMREKFAV